MTRIYKRTFILTIGSSVVFETELIGIDGVPKPESIVTKPTAEATSAEATETPVAEPTKNVGDMIKEKVDEAVRMVKGLLNSDEGIVEEHAEL